MSLTKDLHENKIVAIIRGISEESGDYVAEALFEGGIRFMEVTMNTDGALTMIQRWRKRYGTAMYIGAGTVLDIEMAKSAVDAGAEFLISPNVDEAVIQFGVKQRVAAIPGAMTPTEIVRAWKAGATAVKVFPAGSLGPEYIKELQGPLSHIFMMATGGVGLENMKEYANAGSKAFGVGGNLVHRDWIKNRDYLRLKEQAKLYVEAAKQLCQ